MNQVRFIGDGFHEVIREGVRRAIADWKDLTQAEKDAMMELYSTKPPGWSMENVWAFVKGN